MNETPSPSADRAGLIELVSAAFREAMKDHGLLRGTVDTISVGAYDKVSAVLDEAEPSSPPEPSR
ncbi:hypothetical protein [Actinomadura sp. 3N508]|uniref:hypothetical protein n=1 Tax=Actinomadura sp. 3N508 TaxID=3375153 RepID=UPI0037AA5689